MGHAIQVMASINKPKPKGDPNASTTTAGISFDAEGNRVIPSSQRDDGTVRKERRVRPGFTPAEDVARYQNRTAEAFRTRGTGGIPGVSQTDISPSTPNAAAAANKNAKRKAARKKKALNEKGEEQGEEGEDDDVDHAITTENTLPTYEKPTQANVAEPKNTQSTEDPAQTAEKDKEKQARNIRKKLTQARELQSRREKGEKLLPEQLQKALKMQDLVRELEKLGFEP